MEVVIVAKNVDALAVNTAGIAYDHQVEEQFVGCVLKAQAISSHSLDPKIDYHTTRTLLSPGAAELGPEGVACLWIGMYPKAAHDHTYAALKARKDPGLAPKGTSIRARQSNKLIKHDPFAIRVVVAINHMQNKFLALVTDSKGDSEALRVSQDNIFFFSKFRDDDVTVMQKRGEAWSRKITDHKAQIHSQEPQPKRKAESTIATEMKINFENQLQGLLATYVRDPREIYLEAMQKLLEKKDKDLNHRPVGYEGILQLVDGKKVVTTSAAEAVIAEMTALWPALADINIQPMEIVCISEGICKSGITLEYGLVRVFMVDWIRCQRRQVEPNVDFGVAANEIHFFARMACGSPGAPKLNVVVKDNDFLAFLDYTIENLRSLEAYSSEYVDAVTDSLGGHFSGEGLDGIFQRFAETPDIESAQQWMKEACRYVIMETVRRDEGVLKHLGKLIGHLEEFRLNLAASAQS